MNEMERRVKTLEQKAEEKTGQRIAYAWVEDGQTEEDAERQWREENPNEDVELCFVSWAGEQTWPAPLPRPEGATVDQEIEQIVTELQGEGFSLQEIAEELGRDPNVIHTTIQRAKVETVSPLPQLNLTQSDKAPQSEEAIPAEEQTLQPMRFDEMTRLFGRRR